MDWVSELLFPTAYTTLGAIIGGWVAYCIAKHNFSMNRQDEGKAYVSLLSIYAKEVIKKCQGVQDFLAGWNPKSDTENGLPVLRERGNLLCKEMSSFETYWSKYSETIQHCRLKSVCRNKHQREQYKSIVKCCEEICVKISNVNSCIEAIQKESKELPAGTRLCTDRLEKYKNDLLSLLTLLEGKCNALDTPVANLRIQN